MPFVIGQQRAIPSRTILTELEAMFDSAVNLALDPRFESGARRVYSDDEVSSPTTAVSAAAAIEGGYSLQVAAGDLVHVAEFAWTEAFGPLCFGADVGFCTATGVIGAGFYDVAGNVLEVEQAETFGLPVQRANLMCEPPPLTASASFYCQAAGVGTASFDRILLCPSEVVLDFFDGDSGGCVWTGQRLFSTSERLARPSDLSFMTAQGGGYWSSDSYLIPQ